MPTDTWVARDAAGQQSSVNVAYTVQSVAPSTTLMGCSASPNDHGGTDVWDGWRVYTETTLYQVANRQGSLRPKFLLYSKQSTPFSGTYQATYDQVLADLNEFYYSTGNTPSSRWGIKLYWSNGNEMATKGVLATPHTAAGIASFTTGQRALYDACHYAPGGVRRFPDAYAGSDPTTTQEKSGYVEDWLHPTAQWHDFVAWSNYPGGRDETPEDPTFDWASTTDADWDNAPQGYMVRCVRRTALAAQFAGKQLGYLVGEVGCGNDPDDGTTRPYWIVHGFMHRLLTAGEQYNVPIWAVCWWDNQVDAAAPQNILSDEQAGLNPTSRQAFQNHLAYNHLRGGTRPAAWVGNPKSAWKTSGNVT
jgi:hypothetical protein